MSSIPSAWMLRYDAQVVVCMRVDSDVNRLMISVLVGINLWVLPTPCVISRFSILRPTLWNNIKCSD